jgi:hypothetical protein
MFPMISLGYTASNYRSRYVITKVDLYGNIIFSKAYGDSVYQHNTQSIRKISDGNYIISDTRSNFATNGVNAGLIKIDPSGDTLWTRYFSSGLFRTIGAAAIETSDKGFALAGWTDNGSSTTDQLYLVKTDSLGNKLWQKQYGGSLQEDTRSIVETPDKGFLIAGWTTSYGGGYMDGFLIKTDSLGNQLWQKTYGGTPFAEGIATITQLQDGNYLLAGEKCLGPGVSDNDQGYLVKVDSNGTVIWEKNYGSPNNDAFFAAKEVSDSSLIIAASTWDTITNNWDVWLLKLNNMGDTAWSRIYNYPFYNPNAAVYFFDVVTTQDRGFAFGGFAYGPTNSQDAWLLKVDSLGCDIANCTSVDVYEPEEISFVFNVFPNPANERINVNFSESKIIADRFEIIDYTGKIIFSKAIYSESVEIFINELPSSIYILRLFKDEYVIGSKLISIAQ